MSMVNKGSDIPILKARDELTQYMLGANANSLTRTGAEVTVSGGVLTITGPQNKVLPESGTADDIDTISGLGAGCFAVFNSAGSTNTLTFKHGTGNIAVLGGSDLEVNEGAVFAYSDGTTVYLIGGGAAPTADTVEFTPTVDISSVNVQDAIEEVYEVAAAGVEIATAVDDLVEADNNLPVVAKYGVEHDANTVLAITTQGDNGGTTFTDESANGFTVLNDGDSNVTISNAADPYGGTAGYGVFTYTTRYDAGTRLRVASNAVFGFGAGDFTIEAWFRQDIYDSTDAPYVFSIGEYNNFSLSRTRDGLGADSGKLYANVAGSGFYGPVVTTTNTWVYLAITRQSGVVRIYVDGTKGYEGTHSGSISAGDFLVGCTYISTVPDYEFKGGICGVRVSDVARYTGATHTVPTTPAAATPTPYYDLSGGTIKANIVSEQTAATGVTVDGLLIKDSGFVLGSDADGDIFYRSSGALSRLAKGTAYQKLRMNSGATAPEYSNSFVRDYIDAAEMFALTTDTTFAPLEKLTWTNQELMVRSFADAADEFTYFRVPVPSNVVSGSNVTLTLYLTHLAASVSKSVTWNADVKFVADDEDLDFAAFGAGWTSVDTVNDTAKGLTIVSQNKSTTTLGLANDDLMLVRFWRDGDDGDDDLEEDLYLIGVQIQWQVN